MPVSLSQHENDLNYFLNGTVFSRVHLIMLKMLCIRPAAYPNLHTRFSDIFINFLF